MRSGLLKNHKITSIAAMLAVLVFCISIAVQANTNGNASYTANGTIDVNEYSRDGSTIKLDVDPVMAVNDIDFCNNPDVTCSNLTVGNAKASFTCHGAGAGASNNGHWGEPSYSGTCWTSLNAYYYFGTLNQVAVDLLGSGRNSPSHVANEAAVVPTTSSCPPASQAKGICLYEANAGIITNTGDDMFALADGAKGYIEYPTLGGLTDISRLTYISRNGGRVAQNLMLPSGPFIGPAANRYSDYRRFINNSPGFVTAEAGCYPLEITSLCQGDFSITPPLINGICGTADGNNYAGAVGVNTAGLCVKGVPNPATVAGVGDWNWSCDGLNGGANAACSAKQSIDGDCASLANYQTSEPATNTANACDAGVFVDFSDTATKWRWRCNGANGGANSPTCTALRPTTVNGDCKTISGYASTEPATSTANACDAGTFVDMSDTATKWRWHCNGAGTPVGSNSPICRANRTTTVNGDCKTISGYASTEPATSTANACDAGTFVDLSDTATKWKWRCNGAGTPVGSNSPTCQSNRTTTVNGACKAYGSTYASQPASNTSNGCTAGAFSERSDTASNWRWYCNGAGTPAGTNKSCSASKSATCPPVTLQQVWKSGFSFSGGSLACPPSGFSNYPGHCPPGSTKSGQYAKNNCPSGYTHTEIIDNSGSVHSPAEDSGSSTYQLCLKTSDTAVKIISEWAWGKDNCPAGKVPAGLYDAERYGGRWTQTHSYVHRMEDEEVERDDMTWCLGVNNPKYEVEFTKLSGLTCSSGWLKLFTAHNNEWNLEDEDGTINRVLCARVVPKTGATCP